jgi:hypothetical protein
MGQAKSMIVDLIKDGTSLDDIQLYSTKALEVGIGKSSTIVVEVAGE